MLFKKNVLSSSVAVALVGSTMPSFSQAQELEIEEVIVEGGIRASLKKSMDLKRDTVGVADAISAEDMGKFPDSNLAEALQRITGVSIDRSRGEGSKVTVRGFGPEYNLVTLNGRQMPTHAGTSRSFDFGDLSSEGVSAVVVNKTGNATAPSGGIGSSINIVSTKPLEAGYVRSFGAKAVYDTSVIATSDIASDFSDVTDIFDFQREGISPEFAGIISDTFADDTLGVSLSFSAQERNNETRSASVSGWKTYLTEIDPNLPAAQDMSIPYDDPTDDLQNNNRPMSNTVFSADDPRRETLSIPQSVGYRITEFETERINGQLTIQHRPNDALTASVDYTYSTVDYTRNYNDLSAWNAGLGALQQADWEFGPHAPNGTPKIYNEKVNHSDISMGLGKDGAKTENNSVGLNLEWYASDRLQLEFDYHNSTAEFGAKDKFGTNSLVTIASLNRCSTTNDFTNEFPILVVGGRSEDCHDPSEDFLGEWKDREIYKDDMVITGSTFHDGLNKMEIDQAKISGRFDATDFSSIDFGVEVTEATNRARSSLVQRDTWANPVSLPGEISHLLERVTIDGKFDRIDGSGDEHIHEESFAVDFEELTALASSYPEIDAATISGDCDRDGQPDGSPAVVDAEGNIVEMGSRNFYCSTHDWSVDKSTTEETKAAFVQLTHDTEVSGLPLNIRAGLRYEETIVESEARVPVYIGTSWTGGNEFSLIAKKNPDGTNFTELVIDSGEYDLVLPNLDLNLEIMDELVARASVSKTVTRPNYNDIKGGTTADSSIYGLSGHGASQGNPGLLPIESLNYDLSLEWYYGDTDYISLGYFKKDVDNFIGRSSTQEYLWDLPDVSRGGQYAETLRSNPGLERTDLAGVAAAMNASTDEPRKSCSDQYIQYDGVPCTYPNDPLPFNVSFPINEKNAKVYGLEFNIQHNFGESGYGVIFNYTKPWSNIGYDPIVTTKQPCDPTEEEAAEADDDAVCLVEQFALSGLSETANLIAFYDKDGLSLRFAYNWRDDFFGGEGQDQGAVYDIQNNRIGENPNNTAAYSQLDMSASYEVNDNLTLFVDGLNVTDSYNKSYGRVEMQTLNVTQTGPRYTLGFRYSL